MAFTALLGTTQSRPGNIVLGLGGVSNALNPRLTQTLNLSQVARANVSFARSVSQTLTLTQSGLKTLHEAVSQSLTFTQSAVCEKYKAAGVVQPLSLSHSLTLAKDSARGVFQGLSLTHQGRFNIYRVLSVPQTLTLTHSAVGVSSKAAKNTLVLTQSASAVVAKHVRQPVVLTQTVRGNHTSNRRVFSNLIPFQVVQRTGTFRRTLPQSLTLAQAVSVQLVRPAKSQLVLSQEALVDKVKPGFSVLALTDEVVLSFTKNMAVTNRLFLAQLIGLQKSRQASASHVLAFVQTAKATRVFSRSVSQSLALTQQLYQTRYNKTVTQSLVLSQSAVCQKVSTRSVSQTLVLSQSVQVATTLNRHVQHTLVFGSSFLRYVGLPGLPYIDVPGLQVVLVRRQVILEYGSNVIVLPSAEFDDRESGLGKVNIKRAMDGTRRVYKREQPSSRLVYEFVMDRFKAIELRQFIVNNNSNVIRMTNWKGEIWMVVLTNNPFAFTEDAYREGVCGNRSSITLEFQGVRIN
jgi:hypothetical protein